ncbi:GNAT family N-acetyltransferase [Dermatophilaceae bacterium Sec6.4]
MSHNTTSAMITPVSSRPAEPQLYESRQIKTAPADVTVRLLHHTEWRLYRETRLAALRDAPHAFLARYEEERSYEDSMWRLPMIRARRFIAERGDDAVGMVCLGLHNNDPEIGELFALWTAPAVRGENVAHALVSAAAMQAAEDGCRLLYYWAISDDATAIGFASYFGFRPSAKRRPARVAKGTDAYDADEVAMVLPLTADPTQSPNPYMAFHS